MYYGNEVTTMPPSYGETCAQSSIQLMYPIVHELSSRQIDGDLRIICAAINNCIVTKTNMAIGMRDRYLLLYEKMDDLFKQDVISDKTSGIRQMHDKLKSRNISFMRNWMIMDDAYTHSPTFDLVKYICDNKDEVMDSAIKSIDPTH